MKCKVNFTSDDEADFDGEGFCPTCKEKNKEVAKRVDEIIEARRAVKGEKLKIDGFDMEKAKKYKNTGRTFYANV